MMMSFLDHWRGIAIREWIYSYNPYKSKGLGSRAYNVLYDHRTDPGCLNNLFGHLNSRGIQEELHKKTQAWMVRFNDPFMPYGVLSKATVDSSDIGKAGYIDFWEPSSMGILRVRPVDAGKRWVRSQKKKL